MYQSYMTIRLTLVCMLSVLLWSSCASSEASRHEKAVMLALIQNRISEGLSSRHYVIDVDRAHPDGRSPIHLTSPYSVTISNDTIVSYLPFFGRAYDVPYGGGTGLNFTGRILQYEESITRKGCHLIMMEVHSEEDTYQYAIDLYNDGTAIINVHPRRRSHIAFTGNFHIE